MQPVLEGWAKTYGAKGLTVIDVDNGQRDSLEDLKAHAEKTKASYAILFDEDAKNAQAYGVKGFPAAFLIDASGKVVWEGFPVPELKEIEKRIEKALSEVKGAQAPEGLKITDLVEGKGPAAKKGDELKVHYTGWLENGTKFDSSVGGAPFELILGARQVIKGWDEGLVGMKAGGKRKLVIPAALGYGDRGAGKEIPPGATLIFEVELLSIEE